MLNIKSLGVRRSFLSAFFALVMPFALALPVHAAASTASGKNAPAQLIKKLGDTALMSLTGENVNRKIREERVRKILQDNFDIQTIGRFALGTYWREVSEKQRKEYMSLFEDMIVQTYTARFEDYSGQVLKVDGSTPLGKEDSLVNSRVVQEGGPPVNLEWRVRNNNGVLKVIDVVVEGVSMSITQRSDFSAVIQRGGGDIEVLLSSLRERRKMAANKKI